MSDGQDSAHPRKRRFEVEGSPELHVSSPLAHKAGFSGHWQFQHSSAPTPVPPIAAQHSQPFVQPVGDIGQVRSDLLHSSRQWQQ